MRIRVIKPGVLSTIQDLGRKLYLSQAVPFSGAMDTLSARIANIALGNDENAAVIEFTYANASVITETDVLIAYAGSGAGLSLSVGNVPGERPVYIPAGTTVNLNSNAYGSRTYLAIAGGWELPEVLGSRSTYITAAIGGLEGRALKESDILYNTSQLSAVSKNMLQTLQTKGPNYPNWSIGAGLFLPDDKKSMRVFKANEYNWFKTASLDRFWTSAYTISNRSNRMGIHLEGELIEREELNELLSTAVTPGTIQVTGNGSMVLLTADCQTTGGYPRIVQVAAVDLPLCGQLKPGDKVFFKEITRHEAEMLYLEHEKQLQLLAGAVRNRYS